MNYRSALALVYTIVIFLCSTIPVGSTEREGASLAAETNELYLTAYGEVIGRHVFHERDGTTYVSTGDIPAEWLRDGSAIAYAYVSEARSDSAIAATVRGAIAREATYILIDPYANAFSAGYKVVEEKFEVDSLLYPIWLSYGYWRATGDASIFSGTESLAFDKILRVLHIEQRHAQRSHYTNPQLANNGRGSRVGYTGMIWTGFRPSDDPARYQYNIPVNMFAVIAMRDLASIEREVYHDGKKAADAWGLSVQIQRGVEQYGIVNLDGFGKIYAYEVDGLGHANLMDDANVPSLISIPYFGYEDESDPIYRATRSFALSPRNPYYYSGKYAEGVGSPHTPSGYVWPLALVMQALTTNDQAEIDRILGYLVASDTGDHRLHESFDANAPATFTRADFAWPNALYTELIRSRRDTASAGGAVKAP